MKNRYFPAAAFVAVLFYGAKIRPAENALYTPPSANLPAVLAEFPDGTAISADEYAAAWREIFISNEAGEMALLMAGQSAYKDITDFYHRNPQNAPSAETLKTLRYAPGGWAGKMVFNAAGRDFTWREAWNFYFREHAGIIAQRSFLEQLIGEKILRMEAAKLAPEKQFPAAQSGADCLRQALEPLFTAASLRGFYEQKREDFSLLKVIERTGKNQRRLWIPATRKVRTLPITAYGIDDVLENGKSHSPLAWSYMHIVPQLLQSRRAEIGESVLELQEKIYPRRVEDILPQLAYRRLQQEIRRLVDAVRPQVKSYGFPEK